MPSLTVEYIQSIFDEFNRLIFDGALPRIPVVLGNAASYVGQLTCKSRRRLLGKREYYDYKLRISKRYDLPESEVEDTVIHEMIHYYIRLKGIRDTSAHGVVFRRMMEDINRRFGRHITVSHHTTPEQREAARDKRPRLRVVAIVEFKDGRQGLKLLPPDRRKVAAYHRVLMHGGSVAGIKYHLESDPWFNRYPTSAAYNVFFVPMDEVRQHLSNPIDIYSVTAIG